MKKRFYLPDLYYRLVLFYHRNYKSKNSTLSEVLRKQGKTRWLDLGSSSSFNEGFYFADLHPASEAPEEMRKKYFQLNIIEAGEEQLKPLGKFDLIRLQHVFEHFAPEDGLKVLEKCALLLNEDGYLLMTVPDLKIFVHRYQSAALQGLRSFKGWAETRIPANAPQSFYFSIFTHSVAHQQHLWCYDEEGIRYQLSQTGKFKNAEKLSLLNPLSAIPFTHNRPDEDLCLLAQKA